MLGRQHRPHFSPSEAAETCLRACPWRWQTQAGNSPSGSPALYSGAAGSLGYAADWLLIFYTHFEQNKLHSRNKSTFPPQPRQKNVKNLKK